MNKETTLIKRLISRAYALQYDDHKKANSLVRDSWVIARKVFGEANPYLEELNSIAFLPKNMLANRENIIMTGAWNAGVTRLKDLLSAMKLDQETSDHLVRHIDLEPPDKVTIQWLSRHMSWAGWTIVFAIISGAFLLGVAVGHTTFVQELLGR